MGRRDGCITVKRAIVSVSDKSGLEGLAGSLKRWGVEILSTGGTAGALRDMGVQVKEVSEVTGFPEMLDGRVKTLHPRIHGAILARRDRPDHMEELKRRQIEPIDLVVVNLYPFEQTISTAQATLQDAVEMIDIGGPCMIRAAAKNFQGVVVVVDPNDYPLILREMEEKDGAVSVELSMRLAQKAFQRTALYDQRISEYLTQQLANIMRDA